MSANPRRERGIALFTTLLLLSLVSLLGLAMMVSVNSDMLINGYYGNYRSSFYAADSGLNVARQALINNFSTSVNQTPCTGWGTGASAGCTADPLSGTNASTVISAVKTSYGSFGAVNASGSWPGSFSIVDVTNCTNSLAAATGSPTTHVNTTSGLIDTYTYRFNYTLCATGRAQSLQQVLVKESGSLVMTVQAQTTTTPTSTVSFAAFGAFINNYPPCLGALIPGTMTGPMFTNGAWQFMTGGSYIFTDPVGQANSKADYWFGGTCIQSATSSYTSGGQTIRPTFQGGLNLNQPSVALPPNDFSQKWAVLDGKGCGEGGTTCGSGAPPAPTNANMASVLRDVKTNAYPSGGASTGVFLPYCTTSGPTCPSPNTVTGGGILVEGNANVKLTASTDSSGNPTQVYTITQGSTVTTITTNLAANSGAGSTTMVSGGNTVSLTGVPQNLTGATAQAGTMLYVDGTISSLTGPGQGVAAIADHSQVTVTANGNVNITGDVIYAHEPVTMNTANTLISGNDYNQVLGIFTASGNIQLSSPYSNSNLQVDGSLAAIGSSCASSSCGFTVSGSINTFNNVGGQIQGNIFSANMQTENTYFDRRFTSKPGFAPPWFPSTTIPTIDITNALPPAFSASQPQRLTWVAYPQ